MIRINLLPTKKVLKIPPIFSYGVVATVILVIILLASGLYLTTKVSGMNAEMSSKEKKLEELKKAIEEIKNYEKNNEEVRAKTRIIEQLKKNQVVPLRLLDEVSEKLPNGVWLTLLNEKGGSINIEGYAHTNYDLVAYVQNLKESKYLTDVMLIESRQTEIDSISVYKFKLTFRMKV
jgi:type IV pilus assembly protein PilN